MSNIQALPLPKVHTIWEHPGISKYPETIRVSFSDGKTIKYIIDIEQPHPSCLAAIENIQKMEGYKHESSL